MSILISVESDLSILPFMTRAFRTLRRPSFPKIMKIFASLSNIFFLPNLSGAEFRVGCGHIPKSSFPPNGRKMSQHHVVKPLLPPLTCGGSSVAGDTVSGPALGSPRCSIARFLRPRWVTNGEMCGNVSVGLHGRWSKPLPSSSSLECLGCSSSGAFL